MDSTALLGQINYLVDECRQWEWNHAAEIDGVQAHYRASAVRIAIFGCPH